MSRRPPRPSVCVEIDLMTTQFRVAAAAAAAAAAIHVVINALASQILISNHFSNH